MEPSLANCNVIDSLRGGRPFSTTCDTFNCLATFSWIPQHPYGPPSLILCSICMTALDRNSINVGLRTSRGLKHNSREHCSVEFCAVGNQQRSSPVTDTERCFLWGSFVVWMSLIWNQQKSSVSINILCFFILIKFHKFSHSFPGVKFRPS